MGVRPCGATVKGARAWTPVPGPASAKDHIVGAPLSRTGRPEATPARFLCQGLPWTITQGRDQLQRSYVDLKATACRVADGRRHRTRVIARTMPPVRAQVSRC